MRGWVLGRDLDGVAPQEKRDFLSFRTALQQVSVRSARARPSRLKRGRREARPEGRKKWEVHMQLSSNDREDVMRVRLHLSSRPAASELAALEVLSIGGQKRPSAHP